MKAKYIRVSTEEQNTARQHEDGFKVYEDKISGLTPFAERPKAKQLLADIESGLITEVYVHSIDRLGRSALDVLQTIKKLNDNGINVVAQKEGLSTMVEGKENPYAKVMLGVMATLAEFELSQKKERILEGIAKKKERNGYKDGRGGSERRTLEQLLSNEKNKKALTKWEQGNSIREAAALAKVSPTTLTNLINRAREEGYALARL
jgi:DNA invertase Pin-like site-specific DNA recombinase